MKVLHVFGIMNRGGAELRTVSLIPKMKAHNVEFDFVVLSGKRGVLDDGLREQGCRIHYVPLGITMIWHLYQLFKAERYQIVHSHVSLVSGLILMIAAWAGVSVRIAHFRNTTDAATEGPLRKLRNRLLSFWLLKYATHILAVCQGALDGFWSKEQQNDPRFGVVYNGFATPNVNKQDDFWQEWLPDGSQQPIFINVARMDYQKNHVRQVSIFAEFVKAHGEGYLVFLGKENPTVRQSMESLAEQHGVLDRLVFMGEQPDVLPYLANADVMLFPSMWEGLPGAVIEAASVGIPVLGSKIPGIEEIAGQIAHVVPYSLDNDDASWAKQLKRCLDRDDSIEQRQQDFAQSVFQIEANIEQLRRIYTQ